MERCFVRIGIFTLGTLLILYSKCHNVSNCSAKVQTTAFAIPTSVTRCLTACGLQEKMQLTRRSAGQGTGSPALFPGTRERGPWGAAGQGFPGLVTITNISTVLPTLHLSKGTKEASNKKCSSDTHVLVKFFHALLNDVIHVYPVVATKATRWQVENHPKANKELLVFNEAFGKKCLIYSSLIHLHWEKIRIPLNVFLSWSCAHKVPPLTSTRHVPNFTN